MLLIDSADKKPWKQILLKSFDVYWTCINLYGKTCRVKTRLKHSDLRLLFQNKKVHTARNLFWGQTLASRNADWFLRKAVKAVHDAVLWLHVNLLLITCW